MGIDKKNKLENKKKGNSTNMNHDKGIIKRGEEKEKKMEIEFEEGKGRFFLLLVFNLLNIFFFLISHHFSILLTLIFSHRNQEEKSYRRRTI